MKKFLLFLTIFTGLFLHGMTSKPHSVLSSGKWFKVGVVQTGLHKITYQDFVDMGFDPAAINPANIRVFGNGGKMLPEKNIDPRIDDLLENSIKVVDGGDGTFDAGDYVIFYGEGSVTWVLNRSNNRFSHVKNIYTDTTFYFVTAGTEPGLRIRDRESIMTTPTYFSNKFADYDYHEADLYNIIKTGRSWYGERFTTSNPEMVFPFYFPFIDSLTNLKISLGVLGYTADTTSFSISVNTFSDSVTIPAVNLNATFPSAIPVSKSFFVTSPRAHFDLKLHFNSSMGDDKAWLDYFDLNFTRTLCWRGGSQMPFRDPSSIGKTCTEFRLKNTNPAVEIWEVSTKNDIRRIQTINTDTTVRFRMTSDSLREYIAFDYSGFFPVILKGPVANQDLHAYDPKALIIVTHSLFTQQAGQLAEFHQSQESSLSSGVVQLQDIYNEFSSGAQDVSAIRDFIKSVYDKSGGQKPKYLLLLGDGSYDPLNRLNGNNNYIPTFQSRESLNQLASFVCDDFYGLMGPEEGENADGTIEVCIGRLPVSTTEEADIMVNKIIHYSLSTDTTFGEWRNSLTFLADDENQNLHFNQAELLTSMVHDRFPIFNINKIYNDAYQMMPSPEGNRLPQVNEAIGKALQQGTMFVNYNGHGGEAGLAAEQIVTIPDIQGWTNYNRLPVWVTATCEFSRFDNPERITAGENVLLQPNGGGIALFSTTRFSFPSTNYPLDSCFFANVLSVNGSENPRMGDLIRVSKNGNKNNNYIKNFVLLGDPAQKICYPQYKVVTTSVNDQTTGPYTAQGLSMVDLKGEITGGEGNHINVDGKVIITVYDKPFTNYTIGNHPPDSYPAPFQTQLNVLFKSECAVKEGNFEIRFVIPKNVTPVLGNGKISYYFYNDTRDGSGYDYDLVVGGQDPGVDPVNSGPDIQMYMDDPSFVNGGNTLENTILFARISDNEGINTYNLGLGREIISVLDGDETHPVICNDLFRYDNFSWQNGSLQISFSNLKDGLHTLKLKAWDLYDNSSEKTISFVVNGIKTRLTTACNPNPFFNYIQNARFLITRPDHFTRGNLTIHIFNEYGSLVSTLEKQFQDEFPDYLEIPWDGTSNEGGKLKSGMYFYRVIFHQEGVYDQAVSQKILILN
ncbi:MAG: type IX secretion system sortase PorU [Syntrophothermus sp.]